MADREVAIERRRLDKGDDNGDEEIEIVSGDRPWFFARIVAALVADPHSGVGIGAKLDLSSPAVPVSIDTSCSALRLERALLGATTTWPTVFHASQKGITGSDAHS